MQPPTTSRRSRWTRSIFCLFAISTLIGGCLKSEKQPQSKSVPQAPVEVTLAALRREPVQRTVDVPGTLSGDEETTLSAKVGGRIIAILQDVGDRVGPNEILAQIDKTDYQLQVNQKELAMRESLAKLGLTEFPAADFDPTQVPMVQRAKLQLDNAEARLKRGQQLHEQKPPLLSDQDFADLKTAAAVAQKNHDVELLNSHAALAEAKSRKADLDLAQQQLQDTTIRVPQPTELVQLTALAAVSSDAKPDEHVYAVAERLTSVGEYLKEGTPLFRLIDEDPIKLRCWVPEKHVAELQVGQKVRVNVEAYAEDFWGHVARINPQVDPANRTFRIEVVIPNSKRQLKPGGFAKASVHTRVDPDTIFAPHQAIVTFAGISKVYLMRDGKAVEMIVETGRRSGDFTEIVKGLTGDESVIVSGLDQLATGVPVTLAKKAAE